jgi:hypothetical protein
MMILRNSMSSWLSRWWVYWEGYLGLIKCSGLDWWSLTILAI